MKTTSYKGTKLACYLSYFTMSSIFCIPPVLFVTFQELYGISYTLLGTLILINFSTQLGVDLVFTVFSKSFNVKKILPVMPMLTALGLAVYALIPACFPDCAYPGLVLGTVIFSLSAGLSEVLLSPTIAAIPSDNPQRDMSLLHSLYAFGVLTMVALGTVGLKLLGRENWMYLVLFFAALPLIPSILFAASPVPDMSPQAQLPGTGKRRALGIVLCMGCIFFGSCSENTMSNWLSGFMEQALHIDKTMGDIFGVAMFAVLLGLVRIWYARTGKNIFPVLLIGMAGAFGCYLVAGLSDNVVFAFAACILTGLFTSMLWPGVLIAMEENIPGAGVTAYALMAAAGDSGAAVAPQLMGIVVDRVTVSAFAADLGARVQLSPEQIGMKAGMLVSALFPLLGTVLVILTIRHFRKKTI